MNTKENCPTLDKCAADEPIFVLRAQDELAPQIVRIWAEKASAAGVNEDKVEEALQCADDMEEWQESNVSKIPD